MFRRLTYGAPDAWPPAWISANLRCGSGHVVSAVRAAPGNMCGADGELDALDDRCPAQPERRAHLDRAQHRGRRDRGGLRRATAMARAGTRSTFRRHARARAVGHALRRAAAILASTGSRRSWSRARATPRIGDSAAGAAAAHQRARPPGASPGDPRGTLQTAADLHVERPAYNPPADPGPPRRWGDYSFTSVDPGDDMTMWTIQEYCNAADSYGVRVVAASRAAAGDAGERDAAERRRGPGVGPRRRHGHASAAPASSIRARGSRTGFAARSSGGVTVNGVTYTSPTSVTLDLDTVGAPPAASVTITNPDGQSCRALEASDFVTGGPAPVTVDRADLGTPADGNRRRR